MNKYSFKPLVDCHSKILVLGSLPGEESLRLQQYYANKRNHFWQIMEIVLAVNLPEDYQRRCVTLLRHGIALWDVVYSAQREGSLDKNIVNVVPNNIPVLLKEHPGIKKIYFNGTTAAKLFKKHYSATFAEFPSVCLSSSSPVPRRYIRSLDDKVPDWLQISSELKL